MKALLPFIAIIVLLFSCQKEAPRDPYEGLYDSKIVTYQYNPIGNLISITEEQDWVYVSLEEDGRYHVRGLSMQPSEISNGQEYTYGFENIDENYYKVRIYQEKIYMIFNYWQGGMRTQKVFQGTRRPEI